MSQLIFQFVAETPAFIIQFVLRIHNLDRGKLTTITRCMGAPGSFPGVPLLIMRLKGYLVRVLNKRGSRQHFFNILLSFNIVSLCNKVNLIQGGLVGDNTKDS